MEALDIFIKKTLILPIDLQRIVTRCYTPNPETMILKHLFDIKSWIEPASEGLHNIIYPHCFEIFLGEDEIVKLKYKQWSRDPEWLPEKSDGINVLKVRVIISEYLH